MDSTADSLLLATSVLLGECRRSTLEKPRAKSLHLHIRAAGKSGSICRLAARLNVSDLLAPLPSYQRSTSASGYRGVTPGLGCQATPGN
jgi:hypothetical protein